VLASTKVQLEAAATAESAASAKLAAAQATLAKAQQAVGDARAQVAEQRREIGVFAAQSYTYGDPQLASLAAMFGGGSPIEVSTQLTAADSVMSKQDATLEALQTDEAALAQARSIAAGAEQRVAVEQQAAASTLDRKQALEHTAATQEHAVAALVRSRRTDLAHAAQVKRADLRKLHRLMRQQARIKRRILAEARHQRSRWVGSTSGILEAPVHGPITSPFGYRLNPIYHYWGLHDGDDFGVACGTPAHAARSGRIISEYYSSVWGNRLYLDLGNINGHNFTVIYNHLSAYRMHTGARVRRGTVVAYTGTTGWSTGCHLHFTVMRDGVAVNPMHYIG
jgi:murein DD-endopeptidase MepM/ murein hydrolase activator NlpD